MKIEREKETNDTPTTEDPLKILQVRFAKGEITREEYDEMKSVFG